MLTQSLVDLRRSEQPKVFWRGADQSALSDLRIPEVAQRNLSRL